MSSTNNEISTCSLGCSRLRRLNLALENIVLLHFRFYIYNHDKLMTIFHREQTATQTIIFINFALVALKKDSTQRRAHVAYSHPNMFVKNRYHMLSHVLALNGNSLLAVTNFSSID